ncbi:hypothetical protein [Embleya sp. MST-111070]|uniref:hypothetical protein n=1 Tax=Embleya sp. MST-111070 TaxID=3398231 RepID=UPI003F7347E4
MSIDTLFDQPDIDPELETREWKPVPSYPATVTRTASGWTATIADLPDGRAAMAQGRTWREVEHNAFECVAELLGPDAETFTIVANPADPDAATVVNALFDARLALAHAEQAVRDAARHAARTLTDQGWNTRDAGAVLRLSHQRISQLAPRTPRSV